MATTIQFALETVFSNPIILAIIIGAIGSVMGAILVIIGQYVYREKIVTRNNHSGFWEVINPDENDKVNNKNLRVVT